MADPTRIKVTPAEEEDIVIIAGAVDSDAAPVDPPVASPVDSPSKEGEHWQTTLDDLKESSMSGMQKAIIAVAIVAVAAFMIWYVLLR